MNIHALYEKSKHSPTILNMEDEISFIRYLRKMDMAEICSNGDKLVHILAHLQESHQSNGIFAVSQHNFMIFREYIGWVKAVQKHLPMDIEKYLDGFGRNFDGTLKI